MALETTLVMAMTGRLARLCDGYAQRLGSHDGIAIAELGGGDRFDRDTRPLLDHVFGDQAGVIRSATGDDDDALYLVEQTALPHIVEFGQVEVTVMDATQQRAAHSLRLLEDLLEHEVWVAILLRRFGVPVDRQRIALDGRPIKRDERDAIGL